jgi:hypothetical protein
MADQAVRRDPHNTAAFYNRALAIDRLGLVDEGVSAWTAYLALDSASGWAGDARQRIGRLRAISTAPPPPGMDSALPHFSAYAATDPQESRRARKQRLSAPRRSAPRWNVALVATAAFRTPCTRSVQPPGTPP